MLLALMGVFDGRRVAELIAVSAASRLCALHVLGRKRVAPPWRCSGRCSARARSWRAGAWNVVADSRAVPACSCLRRRLHRSPKLYWSAENPWRLRKVSQPTMWCAPADEVRGLWLARVRLRRRRPDLCPRTGAARSPTGSRTCCATSVWPQVLVDTRGLACRRLV